MKTLSVQMTAALNQKTIIHRILSFFPASVTPVPLVLVLGGRKVRSHNLMIDISAKNSASVSRYFNKTGMNQKNRGQVSINEFLPRVPAQVINKFPKPFGGRRRVVESPNCYATTRNFFRDSFRAHQNINSPLTFRVFMRRNYCLLGEVENDLAYGDIIEDSHNRHSVRYLLTDKRGTHWVFSKPSANPEDPWVVVSLEEAFKFAKKDRAKLFQFRRCRNG